jgi:hypothetical protein
MARGGQGLQVVSTKYEEERTRQTEEEKASGSI